MATKTYAVLLLYFLLSLVWADSPTGGYAPGVVQCPSTNVSLLREGKTTSRQEQDWVKKRHPNAKVELQKFLESANLTGFNAAKFLSNTSQDISIALGFSGGSYRAMLSGAGMLAGLDDRTSYKENSSSLGGILQSSTYISGLSGAAWLLTSLILNNFTSVQNVVIEDKHDLWNLTSTRTLVNTSSPISLAFDLVMGNFKGAFTHLNNWGNIKAGIDKDITAKTDAGFEETITDYWGRGLSYQLFTKNMAYGAGKTFSGIRDLPVFSNHSMPFPILNAVGRKPNSLIYNINSTLFEFNPYELGSFDTSFNAFTDLKYIGTKVTNGKPNNGSCVAGFDNAGFVLGTSSSLFNQFLLTLVCEECTGIPGFLKPIVRSVLNRLSKQSLDVASYTPNPFYKSQYASSSNNLTQSETLDLIDGGLGGEIIPLSSILNTERNVDVAFAFDNTNDSPTGWPTGNSLIKTYEKQFMPEGRTTICPYVPDSNTFLAHNLTAKPTFFGCDAKNLTDLVKDDKIPPLVIYMANRPYEFYSNTSTFKMSYSDKDKKRMVQNGIDVTNRQNGTIDPEWRTCVACAVVRREEERRGIAQTNQCKKCFEKYCWDGKLADVGSNYFPGVNFTDSGLTNGSMALSATAKPAAGSFLLHKRENAAPRTGAINYSLALFTLILSFTFFI